MTVSDSKLPEALLIPCFSKGQWRDVPSPFSGISGREPMDFDRLGFIGGFELGEDVVTGIAIKTWRRAVSPNWFVMVEDCSAWDEVMADGLPDIMDLLSRWAPAVQASAISVFLQNSDSQYGFAERLIRRIETGRWPSP